MNWQLYRPYKQYRVYNIQYKNKLWLKDGEGGRRMCRQEMRSVISPSMTSNLKHSHWCLTPTGRSMSSGSYRTSAWWEQTSLLISTNPDPWTHPWRSLVLETQKWWIVLLPMRKIFKKRIPKSHLKVCPVIALWVTWNHTRDQDKSPVHLLSFIFHYA